jgi:hypothetical protein
MARRKVLLVNGLSALATTLFAVLTFALGSQDRLPIGVLLGLSAGFLLYIAMSDVIPELHENTDRRRLVSLQSMLLVLGVLVVGLSINVAHRFIDEGSIAPDPTAAACLKGDRPGNIIVQSDPTMATIDANCDYYQPDNLPDCGYDGTKFTNPPCFAPDGIEYL